MKSFIPAWAIGALVLTSAGSGVAWGAVDDGCSADHFRSGDLATYAEVREQRLQSGTENHIHPGQNGSIKVHGWNNADVQVKACIHAAAASDAEARTLASQVSIVKGPGMIEASGPSEWGGHSWWSVSYEVWVPASSNVSMDAGNGSIAVDGVHGHIQAHALNGSLRLSDVAGDVDGTTTNGSVLANLAGSGWNGSGLRLHTTNGSVKLNVPENFSARVEASTVNGSIRTDFPVTISGEIRKNLSFVLGAGGATIEARTVNGSVHIGRI